MNSAHNTKKFTYRTQAEVDASLNAKGVETCYAVLIAGATRPQAANYTLAGAKAEVMAHYRVNGSVGLIFNAANGEIVYATPAAVAQAAKAGA